MLGKEVIIQIFHLTDETISVRGGYNLSVGRDPLRFINIINRQLKIRVLHCKVFLERRLFAFGQHGSERYFEISFAVSSKGLPSVKRPLLFEYSVTESKTFAFKSANFFSPLPCLFWQPDPAAPSPSTNCCHRGLQ